MPHHWQYQGQIVTIESPWVTILGERWLDNNGKELEYWRVEKAHSVIVLPLQGSRLLLPPPQFRPGVQRSTLDFPGGRLPDGMAPVEAVPAILKRELGIAQADIAAVTALNAAGWIVNSSFSNQLLYGFVATIHDNAAVTPAMVRESVACDAEGIKGLLKKLDCLQCRAVLQEFFIQHF